MTYDEIKKRLTEVETTLQSMQKIKSTQLETSYTKKSIHNLNTLKESLQKQLAEAEETMFVSTKGGDTKAVKMDRKTAMDLKKDPAITGIDSAKGAKIKEQEGINFSVEETKAITKSVGKALAIALKKAGDEIARMKAHRIEENSFDINVVYKGEKGEDEFSFYISEDTLHLVDFSFDKELVDVGVKPSGEAIVNVDVLANELLKHFKSLNEEEVNEVNYDYYTTPKHFDICPGAQALRDEVLASGKTPEELGEWTFKHDELFRLEKAVLKSNKADERHVKVAKDLAGEITHHSRDLGIEANKIGYLKGHIKKIEDVANKTDGRGDNMSLRSRDIYEGPHQTAYLKVPLKDAKKALRILYNELGGDFIDVVDNDGAGNLLVYIVNTDDNLGTLYDAVMDLQANDIEVVDHNADLDEGHPHGGDDLDVGHQDDEPGMLKSTSYEIATYAAKLYKKLAKYDQVDGEVDFPNWWQSKLILAKDYVSKAYHYLDSEEKQPIIDKLALEHALSEGTELYDRNGINIKRFSGGKRGLMVQVTYGGEYIQIPADEFPILARAMQSVITDLRDMSRQYPRSKNMNEASAAKIQKAHGQVVAKMKELAKQYKAGDKSVVAQLKDLTAKKKELEKHLEKAVAGIGKGQQLAEVTEDEVQDAIYELRNLIDEIEAKGEEAREIVRAVFPNELSRLDAYGAFNAMNSANRYDVTLGGFVDRLEEEGFEIEDGEVFTLEGKYKSDAQRKAIYATKAEKGELKEFTDKSFKGSELIDKANSNAPDMFGKQIFADLLPKGVASENDAFEALRAHDKSGLKQRMGPQFAPMFVHVQYHELEHEGETYRLHQRQYYNSNFQDKDPNFNPKVTEITLIKIVEKGDRQRGTDKTENLGTILVKTDVYTQDLHQLRRSGKLGQQYMEEVIKEGATCCGRCGRVHVKGTKCKTPYLKGKDHCRYN